MNESRKPTSFKIIAGTFRPDRDARPTLVLPTLAVAPPPPDWLLNPYAVREWNRLAPILVANKVLAEVGLSPLAMLCALHGKLAQLWAAGESPVSSLVSQYHALIRDFGLTPVAHSRIKATAATGKANAFSSNGARADRRGGVSHGPRTGGPNGRPK